MSRLPSHSTVESALVEAFVLETGRGQRRLDGAESVPQGLERVADAKPNLQWILAALSAQGIVNPVYLGGYHIEKVVDAFPEMQFRFQRNWHDDAQLAALIRSRVTANASLILVRADTILLPAALETMLKTPGNLVVGVCNELSSLAGVVLVRPQLGETTYPTVAQVARKDIDPNVLSSLERSGELQWCRLDGLAAPAANREAVSSLVFRGKARTLEQLTGLTRTTIIPPQLRFTVTQWRDSQADIERSIHKAFPEGRLVARSSALAEDSATSSGAGRFHSELNIDARNPGNIVAGIERVIDSYSRDRRALHPSDEILLQQQVENLLMSGVMLTRVPNSGAPYFVVNFEAGSGRSDVVTSGGAGDVHTAYISRETPGDLIDDRLRPVIALGRELIDLTHNDALDIEFGCSNDGGLHLFQVRPMTSIPASLSLVDEDLSAIQREAMTYFEARSAAQPNLVGGTTVLSNMSDWNPAEMLGSAPRPLALSLYQRLIGDEVWAQARACIGYRDVGPEPLIHSIGGRPYVDVRASLNSLLPGGVDETAGHRWIDDCLRRLKADPSLQDKIEFDLTVTCLSFDWPQHSRRMEACGLGPDAIRHFKTQLGGLTDRILSGTDVTIASQLAAVSRLEEFRQKLCLAPTQNAADAAKRIQMLIDRCDTFGLMPFSILARYAFIGMSFMRALRDGGEISAEDYERVLQSIPTVASDFTKDLAAYARGTQTIDTLIARYGHLRPNSYEVTSASYRENPEMFASGGAQGQATIRRDLSDIRAVFDVRAASIAKRLTDLGLRATPEQLVTFIADGIAGRERAKFEFMKTVDSILGATVEFGQHLGLSRDQLSFLHVSEIARYARESMSGATRSRLQRTIEYRRKRHQLTEALCLPDVICSAGNMLAFIQQPGRPNFVSRKRITAPIVLVENYRPDLDLGNCIVAIRAADPGFDWIFGHAIAGLVTEYGGIASHMAIRAAEFGLPAAIGCGSVIFRNLIGSAQVLLDCANQIVRPA